MFLISWRGYWQELIETLVWAHQRTPLANLIQWKDKPVALVHCASSLGRFNSLCGRLCFDLCCIPNRCDVKSIWLDRSCSERMIICITA